MSSSTEFISCEVLGFISEINFCSFCAVLAANKPTESILVFLVVLIFAILRLCQFLFFLFVHRSVLHYRRVLSLQSDQHVWKLTNIVLFSFKLIKRQDCSDKSVRSAESIKIWESINVNNK